MEPPANRRLEADCSSHLRPAPVLLAFQSPQVCCGGRQVAVVEKPRYLLDRLAGVAPELRCRVPEDTTRPLGALQASSSVAGWCKNAPLVVPRPDRTSGHGEAVEGIVATSLPTRRNHAWIASNAGRGNSRLPVLPPCPCMNRRQSR